MLFAIFKVGIANFGTDFVQGGIGVIFLEVYRTGNSDLAG